MEIGSQNPLPFVVECKSFQPFFEPIAAFNIKSAAEAYVDECRKGVANFEYRITKNGVDIAGLLAPIPHATTNEKLIVGKLVTDLLAAGYKLSVYDGEEETVVGSADAKTIFEALSSTDVDHLYVEMPEDNARRFVMLVWGNDVDVISDYSVKLEALLAGANALAEELSQ